MIIKSMATGYHSTKQKGLEKFRKMTDESVAYKGEGAMVHGWGLYVQGDRELNVKRYYRSINTTRPMGHAVVDGIDLYNDFSSENGKAKGWRDENGNMKFSCDSVIAMTLTQMYMGWSKDIIIRQCEESIARGIRTELMEQAIDFLRNTDVTVTKEKTNSASQYVVDIPDTLNLLEEKDPVSLYGLNLVEPFTDLDEDETVGRLIDIGEKRLGVREMSEWLMKQGYDGLHYIGDTDGECWVIYDCDKIKIMEERSDI